MIEKICETCRHRTIYTGHKPLCLNMNINAFDCILGNREGWEVSFEITQTFDEFIKADELEL